MFDHHARPRSLYIHWPFCPYKCHFCPFVALAFHDEYMDRYHEMLKKEIVNFASQTPERLPLDTIFLGGGTPSTYPEALLLDTFGTLEDMFIYDRNKVEITIEVNPGTVNAQKLMSWKKAGITRLSIGVQGLNDTVLESLNRHQRSTDVYWLITEAALLFENISIDLIMGLPGVGVQEWQDLLKKVVLWPIKHISVYFLTVHEDTPLYFKVKKNMITIPHDDEMVSLYEYTVKYLEQAGFEQYELSNFAKPGYESRHNTVYWQRKPYKAFGLGACSFDGVSRFQNEKNLMKYLQGIKEHKDVTVFSETLTPEQICLERVMLGLRCKDGIAWRILDSRLDQVGRQRLEECVRLLAKQGLIKYDAQRIVLSMAGLMVHNKVTTHLLHAAGYSY